ncbi:MAG: aminotransferase class I/II-fold pyridoxal phosphate-dependent enzyme [Lachnospiraceae bacterium]|nr:aminotransferase class I/II-fold pyridoxal phosphate-dependent enzyme [Lachnospiraceae bacterium]
MKSEHGGDLWKYEEDMRSAVLDFSANISPLGMPEGVRQAVIRSLEHADIYPDPFCRKLREKLSEKHGIPADRIVCGNGAADLIYRICAAVAQRKRRKAPFESVGADNATGNDDVQAIGRALVTAPSFSEYANALVLQGFAVDHFVLRPETGFLVTEDILHAIAPGTDLVFLGQPNNPAGRTIPRELLLKILDRCTECGALLVLDECFTEFLDEPEAFSLLHLLQKGAHPPFGHLSLVLLRSFTKLYGMAGLRLGYAICADRIPADEIYSAGAPWSVSSAAQAAGLAALQEDKYVERLRGIIKEERHRLTAGLVESGLTVVPGEANYLLFHTADTELGAVLERRGILLRDCRNYRGLGPGWFRTAVRTAEENQRLLQELNHYMYR